MQIREWINICRNFHQTHSFLVVTNIIFLRFYTSLLLTLMLTLLLYICKILITEVHHALTCILMYAVVFYRESYSCQPYTCTSSNCDVPMLDHVRRIISSTGAIYISLRKLPNCVPGGEKALMMWNWCRKCRQVSKVQSLPL